MRFISKKDIIIPQRKRDAKKGDSGKVLIVGGSQDYVGALALAGLAAFRAGCDWVTIAAPEKVAWAINGLTPDLVTIKLPGNHLSKNHASKIIELSKKHTALLIGNGAGLSDFTIQCIKTINREIKMNKVIDADGIKAMSLEELENSIITPHAKELEIILGNSFLSNKKIRSIHTQKSIEKKALLIKKTIEEAGITHDNGKSFFENNNVIVLKGPIDAIITKNNILYDKQGDPGLAKAGTGDVLAGLCAGFLAQGLSLEQSAINATYFTGLAGEILHKKKKGFTYLASDLVDEMRNIRHFRA